MLLQRPHSAAGSTCTKTSMDSASDSTRRHVYNKAAYLSVKNSLADELNSKEELYKALQHACCDPSRSVVNTLWSQEGFGCCGICFTRFCDIVEAANSGNCLSTSENALLKAFRTLDSTGSGRIDRKLLWTVMTTKGEKLSSEEFEKIFDRPQFMKENLFYYPEFCHLFDQTLELFRNKCVVVLHGQKNNHRNNCESSIVKKEVRPKSCVPILNNREENGDKVNGAVSNFNEWRRLQHRGNFHRDDDDNIISHQYVLELSVASNVWLLIEPLIKLPEDETVDCLLCVMKNDNAASTEPLVCFTETRDSEGYYYLSTHLEAGQHILQPFTSGCYLAERSGTVSLPRSERPLLIQSSSATSSRRFRLTAKYDQVLREIFEMVDLDGNGRLNRQEFALFQWQACGEDVKDDEWKLLEDHFQMEDGELTKEGFLDVHLVEAENSVDDDSDLWKTLRSLGYDDRLQRMWVMHREHAHLIQLCPFQLLVYTEKTESRLKVSAMKNGKVLLEKAFFQLVVTKGVSSKIRNLNDLILYTYIGNQWAVIAVHNKARYSSVSVQLDCSKSLNCCSHRRHLNYVLKIPPKTMKVGHYLFPQNNDTWTVFCQEAVVM